MSYLKCLPFTCIALVFLMFPQMFQTASSLHEEAAGVRGMWGRFEETEAEQSLFLDLTSL